QEPKKVVGAFLKLCDMAFVTQESASMLNEAISFQKPVVSLYPKDKKEEENYIKILDNLDRRKNIYRCAIEKLNELDLEEIEFKTLENSSIVELKRELKLIEKGKVS
ncbi:MAG: ELM1/GtrOC1 family putative glycosyltransferase, partial [Campylobacterales bacterium]